jgi:hypothetical protein
VHAFPSITTSHTKKAKQFFFAVIQNWTDQSSSLLCLDGV